tara:strand:- start:7668 stop:8933 length:1266 start_codon:yes stop_codon:yes gene_type:complete
MNFYIKALFIAIPLFGFLIIIEELIAKFLGKNINRSFDVISSLSSGITNTIRDSLKFGVVIISYPWLLEKLVLYKLEPAWIVVFIAFIIKDFSGYWMHRLNHRVNILWNRHIIHHSSEDFNLSCALRQSISNTFRFSAIFMIPAAILGIPAYYFAIIGPIQLFMQFWYHTTLISNLGWLEKIIVTPSHHRVHHAINKEYIDKNYGQIFIIWDKIFGTFQSELEDVKPIYGTLQPVNTWNPIIINFQHLWQIAKDSWNTNSYIDKLLIWFKPTGWRPNDIKNRYPINKLSNVYKQIKYDTEKSSVLVYWSWFQLSISIIFMFNLFLNIQKLSYLMVIIYACFIFIHIFSYTSILDGKSYVVYIEILKYFFGINFFLSSNLFSQSIQIFSNSILVFYLTISMILTLYFVVNKQRHLKLIFEIK